MSGIKKLSGPMQTALVAIAQAMPLAGDKSLALLPVKHGRTVQALEDRKLIKASTSNTGTGVRWTLTDAGWEEASRLELAAKGCKCSMPPWHSPECPVLPEVQEVTRAAAVARAAAAETEWAARNLEGKLRCQALRFEGHQCSGVITCTVTTGEWMELTEDNIEETLASETVEIEDVVKADGSKWDACPVGETLAPGDLIFINVVHRAWCDECVEDEEKFRNDAIITPLAEGDYIPSGSSRYCANGYNNAACDDLCGPRDHSYPGERVQPVPAPGGFVREATVTPSRVAEGNYVAVGRIGGDVVILTPHGQAGTNYASAVANAQAFADHYGIERVSLPEGAPDTERHAELRKLLKLS